jgi:hypothetical protein
MASGPKIEIWCVGDLVIGELIIKLRIQFTLSACIGLVILSAGAITLPLDVNAGEIG